MLEIDKRQIQQNYIVVQKKYIFIKIIIAFIYFSIVIGTEVAYRNSLFDKSVTVEEDITRSFSSSSIKFFEIFSELGTAKVTMCCFGLIFVFLPLNYSYVIISAIIYSSFFTNFMKTIYQSPRPIWKSDLLRNSCNNGFGNPSGHSFTSSLLYLSMAHILTNFQFFTKSKSGFVCRVLIFVFFVIIICLVLFSRVVLGAHSINQVIYGGLLGSGTYFILLFIIGFHKYTAKDFYTYVSSIKNLIISSAIHFSLFVAALLVYLLSPDIDEKEYEAFLRRKGCKEKNKYETYIHDGFYQSLSIFGLIGAHLGMYLLFKIIEKKFSGISEYVTNFNQNSTVLHFFCRLGIILLSGTGIVLYFVIPGTWNIVIIFIFKGALGFFLGLFGLYFIGVYLCIHLKIANQNITSENSPVVTNSNLTNP